MCIELTGMEKVEAFMSDKSNCCVILVSMRYL